MILPIGDQPNPRGTPWVNYALMAVNIAVFLLITLPKLWSLPDPNDPLTQEYLRELLRQYPHRNPGEVVSLALGQLSAYDVFLSHYGYRPADPSLLALFTSMFLHGGWLHLIGNMLFLWIYGDNVEHRLGRVGYLIAYLSTGAVAALGYGLFVPASAGDVPMVGASGAISGVLGFYFVWFPRNKVRLLLLLFPFFFFTILVSARLVLGFYLIIENLLPFLLTRSGGGGVAHGAHLGGFLAGLLAALLLNQWSAYRCRRRASDCGSAQPKGPELPSAERVEETARQGSLAEALQGYLALLPSERRQVSAQTVATLGDWLASQGQADAALGLYRQGISAHPRGPGLDRLFLGIGLVLLHDKRRPAAAYQYLLDSLDADPSQAVAEAARAGLAEIEHQQKWQLRERRRW